jgi:hypothetical protein
MEVGSSLPLSRFNGLWSHKSWKIGGSEGRPFVAKGKEERDAGKEL